MKKTISVVLLVSILFTFITSYASDNIIRYVDAKRSLIENSSVLKKLSYTTYKYSGQYENAKKNADEISIETAKQIYSFMNWTFSAYDEMLLIKQRDYLPEQMKYYYELSKSREITTQNNLIVGLRGVYLVLLNADMDSKLKQKKFELAQKKNEQDSKKYKLGLISKLDVEASEYNLIKAKSELEAIKRSRENACRALNKYIGAPLNSSYGIITYDETFDTSIVNKDINYYIEKALKERAEIVDAQKEIALKQLEKSILEVNDVGNIYRDTKRDYSTIKNEIESLYLKIEKAKLDIENEIKKAYLEIKKEENNVKRLLSSIDAQKRNHEKLKALLKQGMTTEMAVDEMQISINEMENGYKIAVYNYNTKLIKLVYAAGIGPAY
ncbi:MAG: TolC family protein [Clostridia bacterium]|nr:TolC family protein [Clostridia bacterium]